MLAPFRLGLGSNATQGKRRGGRFPCVYVDALLRIFQGMTPRLIIPRPGLSIPSAVVFLQQVHAGVLAFPYGDFLNSAADDHTEAGIIQWRRLCSVAMRLTNSTITVRD